MPQMADQHKARSGRRDPPALPWVAVGMAVALGAAMLALNSSSSHRFSSSLFSFSPSAGYLTRAARSRGVTGTLRSLQPIRPTHPVPPSAPTGATAGLSTQIARSGAMRMGVLLPLAAVSGTLIGASWAMANASAIAPKDFVKDTIAAHDVVIFSKTYCPYCSATKELFEAEGKGYDVCIVELDERSDGEDVQHALLELTGQRTVPNVFVKGQHVGGNDDSQAAARDGRLKELLGGERDVAVFLTSGAKASPKDIIKQTVEAHEVVIFSKTYCPFCTKAKALFAEKAKDYDVKTIELDQQGDGAALQEALLELTGQRTVPNVFVKGHHVGGNDASQAAARNGELQKLLQGPRKDASRA